MSEKKRGTGTAPHKDKNNVPKSKRKAQETGTVDESIVAKMMTFNVEDYLDGVQTTIYGVLQDAISEIEEERETECAKKKLNTWTREYNELWNSIRNVEYSHYINQRTTYEAAAKVEFVARYKEHVPELEEAYRRTCKDVVDRRREQVKARLSGYGMTLQDGRNIDAENTRQGITYYDPVMWAIMASMAQDDPELNVPYATTKAEYDVLTLFSDSALIAAMQVHGDHLLSAIEAAFYPDFDPRASTDADEFFKKLAQDGVIKLAQERVTKLAQAVWAEILPHKWDDSTPKKKRKQPAQLKWYSAGGALSLPTSAVSQTLLTGSPEWMHTGHACVREGDGLYAGIDVRVDAPEDTAEYIAGELLLPCSGILDVHCLDGFDNAIFIAVASIIKHSAEHGIPFDPRRKMFCSTIHKQISPGRRFTASRATEIAASIKRLSTFRHRVTSPLYRRKNGTDIMDGYTTEWVHYLECVPGVDRTGRGERPYIRILEMPLIIVQAEGVDQCQLVPCSIFDRDINDSREVIAIRTTLLTKIVAMKRARQANPHIKHTDITYDLLYWAVGETFRGMDADQRERRSGSIVGMAKRQLDAWAMPPSEHNPTIRTVIERGKDHGYTTERKGNVFALRVYDIE